MAAPQIKKNAKLFRTGNRLKGVIIFISPLGFMENIWIKTEMNFYIRWAIFHLRRLIICNFKLITTVVCVLLVNCGTIVYKFWLKGKLVWNTLTMICLTNFKRLRNQHLFLNFFVRQIKGGAILFTDVVVKIILRGNFLF